jgi:glycosyltransferase involved in cell wall biosynthesis
VIALQEHCPAVDQAKFSVAQLGARRHYAVPRLLAERGLLGQLFTDLSAANWPLSALKSLPRLAMPSVIKRMLDRAPKGVPAQAIVSFPRFGLQYARRREGVSRSRHWVDGGKRFCELILRHGIREVEGIYTFTGAGLELLEWAQRQGLAGVHDQIMASRRTEHLLIARQKEQFPQWSDDCHKEEGLDEYCDRESAEWNAASLIVCGSTFVKDSIVAEGADPSRCIVVPYGANSAFAEPSQAESNSNLPLRVLTVGEVGLRKGSPYVFRAAEALAGAIQLRMVGSVTCPSSVAANAPTNLQLIGMAPRSEMARHYAWADIFLLPSVCEGSAGAIFEALAAGLPVVCTPNSGSIVEDEVSGLVVPAENEEAVISSVKRLADDRELVRQMGLQAIAAAKKWSLEEYGSRLAAVLVNHVSTLAVGRNRNAI